MTTVATFLNKKQAKSRYPKYQLPLPSTVCGVELEVDDPGGRESVVHPSCLSPTWRETYDGSLNNGKEYVLNAPLAGKQLTNAIYQLFDYGTRTTRTFTGSTHIHVNVIDGMRMNQLKTLVLLCYYFEDMLYGVGDYSRKWCGFANPMASIPVEQMKDIFAINEGYAFNEALDQAGRYYGLNLKAMQKYGSVEFRYFPTATSAKELLSWVKLVQLFKKAALETGTPKKLVELLSTEVGVNEFMHKYFSEYKDSWHYVGSFYDVQKRVYKSMIITEVASKAAPVVRYNKKFDETRYGRLLKQPKVKKFMGNLRPIILCNLWKSGSDYREEVPEGLALVINQNGHCLGLLHTNELSNYSYVNDISEHQEEGVNYVRDNLEAIRAYLSTINDTYDWVEKFDRLWEHCTYKAYLEETEVEDEENYEEDYD